MTQSVCVCVCVCACVCVSVSVSYTKLSEERDSVVKTRMQSSCMIYTKPAGSE